MSFRQGQENFDLTKWVGHWFEIGRYFLIWEKDCTGAMAKYKLNPDNLSIDVLNTCFQNCKAVKQDHGVAQLTQQPGQFILKFDKFPKAPPAIYTVLATDYDNLALVGDPLAKKYFYILSREPKLSKDENIRNKQIDDILELTKSWGFDPAKVIINPDIL